jgi:protein TonB
MKIILFILILVPFSLAVKAQTNSNLKESEADTTIYTVVEHEPEFPGGIEKFYSYLQKNTSYPAKNDKEDFQASFIIQMIIEKDGSLTNVKELKRIPNTAIGKEIIKVIKASPKWKPGIQNSRPVRVKYSIPIQF